MEENDRQNKRQSDGGERASFQTEKVRQGDEEAGLRFPVSL